MYCPSCGEKNADDVKFCRKCGADLRLPSQDGEPEAAAPQVDNGEQAVSAGGDGGQGPRPVKRGRNIAIVVIVAAIVVVVGVIVFRIVRSPSEEVLVEEEDTRKADESSSTEMDALGVSEPEAVEPKAGETEADAGEAEADAQEEETDAREADAQEEEVDTEEPEADAGETVAGTADVVAVTDTKTTGGAYDIQAADLSVYDDLGELRVNESYDLVVLDGTDSAQQAINDGLAADMKQFERYEQRVYDDAQIQAMNDAGRVDDVSVSADVVYDNNGIFSVMYLLEEYEGGAVRPEYSVYGLTYSLKTGEEQSLSTLTDLDDAELLDEIKTAVKEWWGADTYFSGEEDEIDAFTLSDFESGYPSDDKNSFMVEGGEIVLLIQPGKLAPILAGYLKIPTGVYISDMHYDFDVDYIIPDSSSRYLDREDLEGLTKEELRIARNEIFARHNRYYRDEPLNEYFSSKSWYSGTIPAEDFSYDVFNDYEIKNLELMNEYDREKGYQ